MCLTKLYYNTYADGAQDMTEKTYTCKEGRMCRSPELKHYDRKLPFNRLGNFGPESQKSVSERQPTPYKFSSGMEPASSRRSKSPSPVSRHESGMYSSRHRDYHDYYDQPRRSHHRSDARDPRERQDRDPSPKIKRSTTMPGYVVIDQDRPPRPTSRDYSRDIPLGPVHLAEEYGRRRSSRDRDRERDLTPPRDKYHTTSSRRHSHSGGADPRDYVIIDDDQERRRQRREQRRRLSTSAYDEASTSAGTSGVTYGSDPTPSRFLPRRAATVLHSGDGSTSNSLGSSPPKAKHLRWDDEVRAKRERQNAEIANRPLPVELHQDPSRVKGILKTSPSDLKGKGREGDDIYQLRQAVKRMDLPRSRDRAAREGDDYDYDRPRSRFTATDDEYGTDRRRRSRAYGGGSDRYRDSYY
ncbi:hypothetical protein B0H63DRAFT_77160 [Podospora didyma]|uniref:Uncharacterized protein n=1 Tax=Podospora didyma TaxID=330526 RepID=A0AAE0N3X8_9PEZI|nr:hypothetical protein B0H63DRAFT_77160 [Podospora didyma]